MSHDAQGVTISPSHWRIIWQVARKEMTLFFSSPIAWLFFCCFAALTLFIVFWGEAYFARNIADVRPMFEWMPILLILLCSTLTMRMWSEERRSGTLEHLMTQPASLWSFAVGKYLACMGLLILALLVMLPLPLTLSYLTDIDWGPVLAGYLATVLLGSAYLSIGLFVSARTQNQIVSLIGSVALCAVFYFIGHSVIVDTLGQHAGELMQSIGTGSRFDAITRGVIDLADLVYYVSLALIFLVLTVYSIERERWSKSGNHTGHRRWQIATALLVLNAIALNLWVGQMDSWRLDTTRGKQYTLSDATKNYLAQLQEPLTLRGYFSSKTHPLLTPLVPQMRDLLSEYEVAGEGRVRVEIIDPIQNPEAEAEANQQFGIEPVPFQVADRYQSSIVSSYFDVLVQYGDEYDVLGFRDLIDVKNQSHSDIDVQLRNPEYDLTRSIRKVLTDFQSAGNVFNSIASPVSLTVYASSDAELPDDLKSFREEIQRTTEGLVATSNSKLSVNVIDPDANGGTVASDLARNYGLRPMSAGLFSTKQFWFHILLSSNGQLVQIPLDDLSTAAFESNLDKGLKRFAKGFTRRVGLVAPEPDQYGQSSGGSYLTLEDYLRTEYDVVREDISDGSVANDIELLILAAPKALDEKSLFAVDQFLMQGGTIIASTANWQANLTRNSLDLNPHESGLEEWLKHHGVTIGDELVMDPQNAAFPAPVMRNVNGLQIQEMRMLDYPWFVDVRRNSMNSDDPILAGIEQVNMTWVSPVSLSDNDEKTGRVSTVLMSSSDQSWLSTSRNVMPRIDESGRGVSPWTAESDTASHALAVASTGQFESFFAGKASPLAKEAETSNDNIPTADEAADGLAAVDNLAAELSNDPSATASTDGETSDGKPILSESLDSVIERSPESARLVIFGSNDFLRDQITQMAGSANGTRYLAPYQLIANAVDVALDDTGLLNIRSRGQFNRTLPPMKDSSKKFWEFLNYALAAITIVALYLIARLWRRWSEKRQLNWIAS